MIAEIARLKGWKKVLTSILLLNVGALILTSLQAIPPHLVVFLSDDLGRLDTSIHGSPDAITPTMDQLAASGMVFENAYVASPSCCPNRFSLLTGLMPARHGAHPNHSQPKPGTQFLPPVLKQMGYTVLSFGKVAHGRDDFPGCDFNSPKPVDMSTQARQWFDTNEVKGPICLMVGDRRPHVPWIQESSFDPAKVTLPPFLIDTPETREHWARYLTDVQGMDEEMGRIYALAKEVLGDDFVFLFSSDHGGQWPLGKWNLYDYGARIPLVVSWPGKIQPGTRTDAMVSWVDLLPTLIDLAEGEVPSGIDGRSFAPVLLAETETHREQIFTTHTGDGMMNIFPIRSVRIGKYKFIHNLRPDAYHTNHSDLLRKDGAGAYWDSWNAAADTDEAAQAVLQRYYKRPELELFDLEKDPLEQENLAESPEYATILKELQSQLDAWTKAQGDDLQPHREPYLTSEPLPEVPAARKGK